MRFSTINLGVAYEAFEKFIQNLVSCDCQIYQMGNLVVINDLKS